MVKVVGKDKSEIFEVTCRNCASILEYTRKETIKAKGSDYSGDTWFWWYVVCPECNSKVDVSEY